MSLPCLVSHSSNIWLLDLLWSILVKSTDLYHHSKSDPRLPLPWLHFWKLSVLDMDSLLTGLGFVCLLFPLGFFALFCFHYFKDVALQSSSLHCFPQEKLFTIHTFVPLFTICPFLWSMILLMDFLSFLDWWVYSFNQIWKNTGHYSFKYFFVYPPFSPLGTAIKYA